MVAERIQQTATRHGAERRGTYVMRELGVLFRASEDEEQKGQVTLLEKAFRNPLTKRSSVN
jgi:hypothetical protein